MRKRNFYFLILVLLAVSFLIYTPVLNGFFQHDEWLIFDAYMSGRENLLTFFRPAVSHYAPLTKLFFSLYVSIFRFNFIGYGLLSILAHLAVVFLSFIFFSKLLKDQRLGLIASLFFAVGASSHQATSWVGADINTHGSTIFGLLALIVLLNTDFKKIWLVMVLLIISLLFKEITIAFFALLPLIIYLFSDKGLFKSLCDGLKFVIIGFLYLSFRFSMIFLQRVRVDDHFITDTQSLGDVVNNIITFPAKIFAQTIIPIGQLVSFSRAVTKILPEGLRGLYGTTAFDVFMESITHQVVSWIIFVLGILLLILTLKKTKDTTLKKTAVLGFIFVILNSFIYVLSPDRRGNIPVVDSRNIYLPSLGTALFLVSAVHTLTQKKSVKTFLVILPLLMLNVFWLEKELFFLAERGTERRGILYQIQHSYPTLPKKVIFYMDSDTSFYGMPESVKMFPFEINFGYTLLVWYQPTEHFPRKFLDREKFLYDLTDQGYQEIDGRGFGYFRDWDLFVRTLKENNLGKDSIVAFSYDSGTKLTQDITFQTRAEIFDFK